jgi:hypothetical protein
MCKEQQTVPSSSVHLFCFLFFRLRTPQSLGGFGVALVIVGSVITVWRQKIDPTRSKFYTVSKVLSRMDYFANKDTHTLFFFFFKVCKDCPTVIAGLLFDGF